MNTVLAFFHLLFHLFADSPSLWGPQGWVTLMPTAESGPKFNLSGILCLSVLSACSMKTQSKMEQISSSPLYDYGRLKDK